MAQKIRTTNKLLYEDLTYKLIGAGKEVYKELGPGYLESVYEDALCYELDIIDIVYQRQIDLDVRYKDVTFKKSSGQIWLLKRRSLLKTRQLRRLQIRMKPN